MKPKSEFRKDIVSGEWILVASARSRRPMLFQKERLAKNYSPKKSCPFENPQKNNPMPILWYPAPGTAKAKQTDLSSWFLQIVPNKYPAVTPELLCPQESSHGPFPYMDGGGFHEIIITRDHDKTIDKMTADEVFLLLRAYKERYLQLKNQSCLAYILIFHNQGPGAGASVSHPHSQLMALPIIPPDVASSLYGSGKFWQKEERCVHCVMLDYEKKEKKRIIFQNDGFSVIAPYASRVNYEVRIFPNRHVSSFEDTDNEHLKSLAQTLKNTLLKIKRALGAPDYNFFIHTAPVKKENFHHYHWHIEILPKTSQWAGFELGSGIDVITVFPEETAKALRASRLIS